MLASSRRPRSNIFLVSDTAANDASLDRSGPVIREILTSDGRDAKFEISHHDILPDDENAIVQWVQSVKSMSDWILTTGGTGFGTRDLTPEVCYWSKRNFI